MTVAELIKELQTQPQHIEVLIWGNRTVLVEPRISYNEGGSNPDGFIVLEPTDLD
jgi:hypothetical protein